jgi:hypothetical protein
MNLSHSPFAFLPIGGVEVNEGHGQIQVRQAGPHIEKGDENNLSGPRCKNYQVRKRKEELRAI